MTLQNNIDSSALKIKNKYPTPTKEARDLKEALEQKGVLVYVELDDGHKHIDLAIPRAKLNVEVDGIKHLTDPHQILSDLGRGYYSLVGKILTRFSLKRKSSATAIRELPYMSLYSRSL